MDAKRHAQIQSLFEAALEYSECEQDAFLKEACKEDPTILKEVRTLLNCDRDDKFLETPAIDISINDEFPTDEEVNSQFIGKRIGQYTITRHIASGGMGIVYEAQQDNPKRTVALKIMRRGIASRNAHSRFKHESHILGQLQHANIAQVFEARVHYEKSVRSGGEGIPYFAMEYIADSLSIVQYVNKHILSLQDRIRLIVQVARAVHHGHQRGIIHRDLKPENILIDKNGQPRIIDFGVARVTDSDITIASMHTDTGQLIGTIQYMSPEQCDANPDAIDTRTDVYALGVILYELLTGELPYSASSTTIYRAAQIIRETIPQRLSTYNRKLRGDLETIVSKTLDKDPEKRYQSTNEFANDLERYMKGEPIQARPPDIVYRAAKFVERYRWQTIAGISLIFVVIAACVITVVLNYAYSAEEQKEYAETQQGIAETQKDLADTQKEYAEQVTYGATMNAAEAAIGMHRIGEARNILNNVEAADDSHSWVHRHLQSRLKQEISILEEYDTACTSLNVDASHNRILITFQTSEGTDGQVVMYDLKQNSSTEIPWRTGEPDQIATNEKKAEKQIIRTAGMSNDGMWVAVAHSKKKYRYVNTIQLWNVSDISKPVLAAEWETHLISNNIEFHPTQPILAVGGKGSHYVELWDIHNIIAKREPISRNSPELISTLKGHSDYILSMAFEPIDGMILATASSDHTVRLWDVSAAIDTHSVHEIALLDEHAGQVLDVAFSPAGTRLATASMDQTVRLWDVSSVNDSTSLEVRQDQSTVQVIGSSEVITGYDAGVHAVSFDTTGKYLIAGCADKAIRIYDVDPSNNYLDTDSQTNASDPCKLTRTLYGHEDDVHAFAALPDGRFVSGSFDGTVRLWSQHTVSIPKLEGHLSSVRTLAYSPDGKYLASGSYYGDLIIWDTHTWVPAGKKYIRKQEAISDISWDKVEGMHRIAVTTSQGGKSPTRILIWYTHDPLVLDDPIILTLPDNTVADSVFTAIAINTKSNRIAAGTNSGQIVVWEVNHALDMLPPVLYKVSDCLISDLVFIDDGCFLAVVCDATGETDTINHDLLNVLNIDTGTRTPVVTNHDKGIQSISINNTRDLLCTTGRGGNAILWSIKWANNTPDITPSQTLKGHNGYIISSTFHPTEPLIATGGEDRVIKIWDPDTGVEIVSLHGQTGVVNSLRFSPDGNSLSSASAGDYGSDNVVYIWDTNQSQSDKEKRAIATQAYHTLLHLVSATDMSFSETSELLDPESPHDHLSIEVLQYIQSHFNVLLPHPEQIISPVWEAILDSNTSQEDLLKLKERVELAYKLAPENRYVVRAFGILQYRLGKYELALTTLKHSSALNSISMVKTHSTIPDLAFQTMCLAKLGRTVEAQTMLNKLQALIDNSDTIIDIEISPLISEAENIVSQ